MKQHMKVGRSLTVGGPDELLPDTPQNIVTSGNYNQSMPLIIGATKHDGSYYAGGENSISGYALPFLNPFSSRILRLSGRYE